VKDQYIADKCLEIRTLIEESKNWAKIDDKLGAHLATYINVVILGIMEDCIEYLVKARAKTTRDSGIENYISKDIEDSLEIQTITIYAVYWANLATNIGRNFR